MLGTESCGSCVFYSETWEEGRRGGEEKRLCPLHRGRDLHLQPLLHSRPKPYSGAGISSEAHHGPEVKSCLGKRSGDPPEAGRS